jgi:uncharacterized UBP type Zn finger protein
LIEEYDKKKVELGGVSVLSQVRDMFAYLQESDREFYDTNAFMKGMESWCHLDWRQQQDASEFLMFFVDRLEKELSLTDHAKIFNDFKYVNTGEQRSEERRCI